MTTNIGHTSILSSRSGYINADNVVADYQRVPPGNGWLTGIAVHAGGKNDTTTAQLAIWDIAQGNELVYSSPLQTWAAGRGWRTASIPGLRVSIDDVLRWGFWCNPERPASWSLSNAPSGSGRHFTQTYQARLAPPPIFDPTGDYDHNLTSYVIFEPNRAPLKGVWRPPTPAGIINDTNPIFSGTIPHPGASVGAIRSGQVRMDQHGEPYVQPVSTSESDMIGFCRINDDIAPLGPQEVYESLNSEYSRMAARATQGVRLQADDIYDRTIRVRVQIRRLSDNVMVYDQMFEPSTTENNVGYFTRQFMNLTAGQSYAAKFMHQDSWGLWSTWSDETTVQVGAGPGQPLATAPSGKIASGGGYNYVAQYRSTNGRSANQVEFKVYNETGSTTLYTTKKDISPHLAPNGTYTLPKTSFHETLTAGRSYQWRVRFRDSANVWGTWSQYIRFSVNRAPNAPSGMAPASGRLTDDANLRVLLSDPDRDFPQQVDVEVYNVATNTILTGYPKTMTISSDGTRAARQIAPDLTLNTSYRWRARAYDGFAWSEWSQYAQFTYAAIPNVTLLSPKEGGVRNLIRQGSAEYDPDVVGAGWSEFGRTATRYIERIADGDAAVVRKGALVGVAWEATTDGNSSHYYETAEFSSVDPTKHHHLTGYFKTKQGAPKTRFTLACYNSSGTYLGEVVPSSIGALNEGTPTGYWSDYGGEVWHSGSAEPIRFITGTTQVKVRWYPSYVAGASGVIRMDGVAFYEAATASSSAWLLSQAFWGYVDPDSEYFTIVNDRLWEGQEGNATSRGPAMLIASTASIEIGYSSAGGRPKIDDRVILERWGKSPGGTIPDPDEPDEDEDEDPDKPPDDKENRRRHRHRRRRRRRRMRRRRRRRRRRGWDNQQHLGESISQGGVGALADDVGIDATSAAVKVGEDVYDWLPVHETNFSSAGARTSIPLPPASVQNEGRYRVTVQVKDSLGQIGMSEPVEFDVVYEGAPELPISQVAGDPTRGEIVVNHVRSDLDPTSFSHIEVEITDEEGETWIDVVKDQNAERYVFWAPISGEQYRFRIRQVQLIGNETLESRWQSGAGSVDYHPDFFLKSVTDPEGLMIGFKVPGGSLPTYTPKRFRAQYLTFESERPKGASGAPRYEEGETPMLIFDDPEGGATAEQKIVILDSMLEAMGVFVLLSHHPGEVRFIEIRQDGVSYSPTEYEDYLANLQWVETHYLEDYYERGGDPIL